MDALTAPQENQDISPAYASASSVLDPAHMSDADIARLVNQFVSDCAGAMVQPPSELYIPPVATPPETVLAANLLHEFMEKGAPTAAA